MEKHRSERITDVDGGDRGPGRVPSFVITDRGPATELIDGLPAQSAVESTLRRMKDIKCAAFKG